MFLKHSVFDPYSSKSIAQISDERFHVTYLYSTFHAKLLNNVKHKGPAAFIYIHLLLHVAGVSAVQQCVCPIRTSAIKLLKLYPESGMC